MKVYVVITNGAEVKGSVEGVYLNYDDADTKFEEIIEDWEKWSDGDEVEVNEDKDFYSMLNLTEDEYLELKIIEKEVK